MTAPREAFLAWPGRELRSTIPLCAAFAILFALCYGGASWWTSRLIGLSAWDLPFESSLPFVPSLAIVYLTITPALMLAPFVFRSPGELVPLWAALVIETLVATAFFFAFPQTTAFARPVVHGWAAGFFNLADAINLEYNQFPSLHVAFACTAAWAYARRSGAMGRALWIGWSAAVAASALLIQEHHLVDLVGGAALAAAGILLVYRPLERRESRSNLWAELCCLEQCARFSIRHRRYFVIFLAIWLPSLLRWRARRAVRFAFCTAQWIDDLLDGDRASAREPLEVVDELIDQMTRRRFTSEPLSRLTGALFAELDAIRSDEADPQAEFIALVCEMRVDRERVLARAVWDERQLAAHHRRTFELSVDLMLVVTGCRARASDVPALLGALAWCSVFRDLDDDLAHGLVNVPRSAWSNVSVGELRCSEAFRAWSAAELTRSERALESASREIEALDDARARRLLETFRASIVSFARRQRSHDGSFSPGSVAGADA
ncbi:MAG: phosphatase PAP2 family protein [Thermoanaerobaculia bacterium]|jgi:membrane-associated phospholipid phosphatase